MRSALAVLAGGMLGTALRLGIDRALPHGDTEFPASTLIINTLGAFVLGWLVAGLWTRPAVPVWLKLVLGPGMLGAFTTFSAVMVSLVSLGAASSWPLAGLYLLSTLLLGFPAAALGVWLGGRIRHRPAADAGGRL